MAKIFELYGFKEPIEFTSHADVPAGTGLGSSGTFAVSSLNTVRQALNLSSTPYELAMEASRIEIELLKEPSGLQDQFISAYGGPP